jgi:CRISPR-associated endonuclease/helicase Cas3
MADQNEHAYFSYWGKARKEGEPGAPCHLLPYHCLDVAAVGAVFLERHRFLRAGLAGALALPETIVTAWIKTLLAFHDLGKFAESFQQLVPNLRKQWWGEIAIRHYEVRHDTLGFLIWHDAHRGFRNECEDWLGHEDFYAKFLQIWLPAVTGHHGAPPRLPAGGARAKAYFQPRDVEVAKAFCTDVLALFRPDAAGVNARFKDKAWKAALKESTWILAGLAVLCDWLGSDSDVFEYRAEPMPLDEYWRKYALPRAEAAVRKSGVLPAAKASPQSLRQLFPSIEHATPLQRLAGELPISPGPQLFILEDVTGAGKTEAAMLLAHRLMVQDAAQGVFIALPTMATANAMYERMAKVYRRLFSDNESPSLVLAHSARHLSETFSRSVLEGMGEDTPYGGSEETASVQCAAWLADHRKKALLADVGIGTVDQALLGILPARHQSLRLLGLSNKVLVVDEVHACDAYMHRLLCALLKFHARFGGSAILLSATLPHKMRRELLAAFHDGLQTACPQPAALDYPLLTHGSRAGCAEMAVATRTEVRRRVGVRQAHGLDAVYAEIRRAVEQGRCVCWVRNTVHDARTAYAELAASGWVDADTLALFHSRYTLQDRLRIEGEILRRYGEASGPQQRAGRVLVATQVVEQSLDLDFDVMVSDLAPIDLLIQRAGRLQRHVRGADGARLHGAGAVDLRPAPELLLFTPEPTEKPSQDWFKSLFPKANAVYADTGRLWRTARVLAKTQGWNMPEDARFLIEQVYGEDGEDIPEALEHASREAEGERRSQGCLADFNALRPEAGYSQEDKSWDDEAKIPTRLSDDSATVYLATREDGVLRPLHPDGSYPWDLSSLHVPVHRLADWSLSPEIQALQKEQRRLKDGMVLVMLPEEHGWTAEGGLAAVYDPCIGLLLGDEAAGGARPAVS